MDSNISAFEKAGEIRVVLARPKDSRNIGAVCRAMKTMGAESLYIVGTDEIDLSGAETLALHANDILSQARFCKDLDEAVTDCNLVAGFTRRQGKWRKYHYYTPRELGLMVVQRRVAKIALVFGNEASGLSDSELSSCNIAVTIPSSSGFPSLNLSHAVQIALYELFLSMHFEDEPTLFSPLNTRELADLCSIISDSLKSIGFFHVVPPEDLMRFLRDILTRAGLSRGEADRLENIFRKIAGIVRGRNSTDES